MLDLFETSYNATIKYVSNNISNPMNKDSYLKEAYFILNNIPNHSSVDSLYAFLLKLQAENYLPSNDRFYIFANPSKYYRMAVEHAFDLIDSLNRKQGTLS